VGGVAVSSSVHVRPARVLEVIFHKGVQKMTAGFAAGLTFAISGTPACSPTVGFA
jgi:hypothetical protein